MATDVISDRAETEKPDAPAQQDSAKCRQIMDGAREVFLAQGFDAASMGEIARKAGVSKGTLYVYFDSKSRPLLMRSAGRRRKPCFPSIRQITTSKPCSPGLAAAL